MLTIMQEGLEKAILKVQSIDFTGRNAHHNAGGFRVPLIVSLGSQELSRNAHHNAGGFRAQKSTEK